MRPSSIVNTDGFSAPVTLTTTYQLVSSEVLPGPLKSRGPFYWKNVSFNGLFLFLSVESGTPTKVFVQVHAQSNGSAAVLPVLELTVNNDLAAEGQATAATPITLVPAGRAIPCDEDGEVHLWMKVDAGTANVLTSIVDFGTPNPIY